MSVASPYLTPPAVAKRLAVDPAKILAWIRSGELRAVNTATTITGRPRYKISPADLAAFEAARAAGPTPKVVRRRRKDPSATQYF
ncbi:MAG: helix-turn-helix domain-containing protein [Pirellulales bacterium]|nr:helix-turn-helix domain-containing protein [Pirellulales bacterium]